MVFRKTMKNKDGNQQERLKLKPAGKSFVEVLSLNVANPKQNEADHEKNEYEDGFGG